MPRRRDIELPSSGRGGQHAVGGPATDSPAGDGARRGPASDPLDDRVLTLGELQASDRPLLDTLRALIADPPADAPTLGAMPLDGPSLRALAKPIQELLGLVLTRAGAAKGAKGLPAKLRLTNFNPRSGAVQLHGTTKAGTAFEATPKQIDALLDAGALDVEQPPAGAVNTIRARLQRAMGGPGGRALSEGEEAGIASLDELLRGIHGDDFDPTTIRPNPFGHGTRKR